MAVTENDAPRRQPPLPEKVWRKLLALQARGDFHGKLVIVFKASRVAAMEVHESELVRDGGGD